MLARQINVKSHHTTFVFDTHRTGGNTELLDQTIQSQSERVCCVLVLERFSNLYTSVDTPASVNNMALGPDALVLADARPPGLLACVPDALVLADARPPALFALAPLALVRAHTARLLLL